MKLNHFFKIITLVIISLLYSIPETNAYEKIDERIKKLTLELRCMTCQNQSIYDSDSEFSKDIKKIVKKKFENGESERDIKKFLVERYGEYILFRPLFDYKNLFLWGFPFILLTISLLFLFYITRKK